MSRKTLRLACAVVALSCPAFAQQSPPQPGNAPAPSAKADVEQAIPLTPGMIRDLGRRVGDNKRAEEEVNTEIASPISRRVNVSFAPGQSTPIVRVVKGYPTALSFFDRTGQPWPIEWDTNSNPAAQANNGNCNQGPAGGGGPAVASAGFYVCTPTAGSNVLQVAAASLQPRGGLLVTLKGAPKPISFMLVAGGRNLRRRSHGAGGGARSERQGSGDRPGRSRHRFALPDRNARRRAARRGRALGGQRRLAGRSARLEGGEPCGVAHPLCFDLAGMAGL